MWEAVSVGGGSVRGCECGRLSVGGCDYGRMGVRGYECGKLCVWEDGSERL